MTLNIKLHKAMNFAFFSTVFTAPIMANSDDTMKKIKQGKGITGRFLSCLQLFATMKDAVTIILVHIPL